MVEARDQGVDAGRGVVVKTEETQEDDEALIVLFDGECPLCRREIAHLRKLAQRTEDNTLCFRDISAGGDEKIADPQERTVLLARFHVQRADGSRIDGAAAFVTLWGRLPGWRWLARLARIPGMLPLMERAYSGFLRVRPSLQRLARRLESSQQRQQ